VYDGNWIAHGRDGYGVLTKRDGSVYKGAWEVGKEDEAEERRGKKRDVCGLQLIQSCAMEKTEEGRNEKKK